MIREHLPESRRTESGCPARYAKWTCVTCSPTTVQVYPHRRTAMRRPTLLTPGSLAALAAVLAPVAIAATGPTMISAGMQELR